MDRAASKNWEKVVKEQDVANFLQSPEYGRMNALLGAEVVTEDFDGLGWALMIVRDAKRGRYLEIPCGPLIDWGNADTVKTAFAKIKEVAKQKKCVFVRVRPQLTDSKEHRALLAGLGMKKAPMHLAAEHTVMIDLRLPEETLLANMRRQTRYEVRRADKLGLTVSRDNSEAMFREFRAVQAATAKRQGFVPPSLKTLLAEKAAFNQNIWIYVAKTGEGPSPSAKEAPRKLPTTGVDGAIAGGTKARRELPVNSGEPVAYGLIIGSGKEADYYEAASTDLNRKLPGAYALLWQAMRDLKSAGYERFNLWGIAPPGQPHHRYAGVTTFKTGFGGQVVEWVPAHDLIISPVRYLKNYIVETARKKRRHL